MKKKEKQVRRDPEKKFHRVNHYITHGVYSCGQIHEKVDVKYSTLFSIAKGSIDGVWQWIIKGPRTETDRNDPSAWVIFWSINYHYHVSGPGAALGSRLATHELRVDLYSKKGDLIAFQGSIMDDGNPVVLQDSFIWFWLVRIFLEKHFPNSKALPYFYDQKILEDRYQRVDLSIL